MRALAAVIACVLLACPLLCRAQVQWATLDGPVPEPFNDFNHTGTDGSSLYTVFATNQFWRYSFPADAPASGIWTRLPDPPRWACTWDTYSDLGYQNGRLYTSGITDYGDGRTIQRYSISGGQWEVWQDESGRDLNISNLTHGILMNPAQDGVGIAAWHAGGWWVEFNWNARTADNNWLTPSGLPITDANWTSRNDDPATGGAGNYFATKNDWTAGLSSGDVIYTWTGLDKGAQPHLLTGKPWQAGFGQSLEFIPGTISPSGHDELWLARGTDGSESPQEGWGVPTADWARLDLSNVGAGWQQGTLPGTVGYNGEMLLVGRSVFVRGELNKWYVTRLSGTLASSMTPSAARDLADGQTAVAEAVVSTVFPLAGELYLEGTDRACGLRVKLGSVLPPVGQQVAVTGTMQTDALTRERYLQAESWRRTGDNPGIRPLAIRAASLGGAPLGLQGGPAGGTGLNNVGLLVRVEGKALPGGDGAAFLTLNDGSAAEAPEGLTGVRVIYGELAQKDRPEILAGDRASAVGVSTLYEEAGRIWPCVRVARRADICNISDDGNRPRTFRALVINLDPVIASEGGRRLHEVLGWNDPHELISGYLADLHECSAEWLNYRIVEWIDADLWPQKLDGFSYTDEEYLGAWRSGSGFHQPDKVDYYKLIADFGLAGRVKSGEVDEVFFIGAPYMGFWEAAMAGPKAFFVNGGVYPEADSGRRFVMMGFSYERQVGEMLEDFGHRAESTMEHVYGGWNLESPSTNWDRFTLYDKVAPGQAACGDVHFAPNSDSDYDWGNPRGVWSSCGDWLNWPNLQGTKRWVTADEWGNGDTRLHHRWWLRHFPNKPGVNPDGKQNNWWKYLADFNSYPECP